ncbi:MAG: hypothetical protein AAF740_00045 [Bacteroidota bacterium]
MKPSITKAQVWLRAIKKYRKLQSQKQAIIGDIIGETSSKNVDRKLNILRRRILRLNKIWRLGIAVASLAAWLGTNSASAQVTTPLEVSSLNGTNGFVIEGETSVSGLGRGRAVTSVGDINGDGISDFALGADQASSGNGKVYVIFGGNTAAFSSGNFDLSSLDGTNGFTLEGNSLDFRTGYSVACAGDVNGDEIDDMIVGAIFAGPAPSQKGGGAYVVFGSTSMFPATVATSQLNGTNGFSITNSSIPGFVNDFMGTAVSSAGDFNGDEIDDFMVSAVRADANGVSQAGETYLIFGELNGPGVSSIDVGNLNGTNGLTIKGEAANDRSGSALSPLGDFNGDGFDDFIIGAYLVDRGTLLNTGASYIIFGKSTLGSVSSPSTLDLSSLNGTNGFIVRGEASGDLFGRDVSGGGDFNRDGLPDIVVGAYGADPSSPLRPQAGKAYVIFGDDSGGFSSGLLEASALNGTNGFAIHGTAFGEYSGISVEIMTDVNGDGLDDLLIGAPQGNGSVYSGENGRTYVIFGRNNVNLSNSSVFELSDIDGVNGYVVNGVDADDYMGSGVSSIGDINGDQIGDILIGASAADPNSLNAAGEAYVIYGEACISPTATISINVNANSRQEDGGVNTFIYTFSASNAPNCIQGITVSFSITGTATFNDDYYLVSGATSFNPSTLHGTVTIPIGVTSTELVIQTQQDALFEPDETITVTVEAP